MLKLLLLVFTTSCASYTDEIREMRDVYHRGDFQKALDIAHESSVLKSSNNRLLRQLEEGMILDRKGQLEESRKHFLNADRIVDELYTESISKNVLSYLYNDSSTDYSGEDYEKVAIHTMLALSFISSSQYDAARVEARKINSVLNDINSKYEDGKNRYGEDAFARYLAGIIYEMKHEYDSAIIDYSAALNLYKTNFSSFVDEGIPSSLYRALYRCLKMRDRKDKLSKLEKDYPRFLADAKAELNLSENYGEVIVLHDVGEIAHKEAENIVLPIGGQVVRFSWPVIRGGSSVGENGVTVGTDRYFHAQNVADMNSIARATMEDKRGRMILKGGARLLIKGQITEQVRENFGPLAGLAANVYSAVSETADTRSWTLLPQGFFVTRIRLLPGSYDIHIKSQSKTAKIKKIDVKKNQILLVR